MTSEAPSEPSAQAPAGAFDASALQKMIWFGVLQLAGVVVGWIVSFYLFGTAYSSLTALGTVNSVNSAQMTVAFEPVFRGLPFVIPLVGGVQIVALAILATSFWQLRNIDRKFSVPSIFVIVAMIGGGLAVLGLIPFFASIRNIITQAPAVSAPGTSVAFSSALDSLIVAFLLLAVGGLLTLIGLIGGQILGLWRAGSRYKETLLKLGAIFAIIPFLSLIAPVLVIVGANQVRNRLRVGTD